MIAYKDALKIILEKINQSESVFMSIEKASGYIASDNIYSPINVVSYRNSAMDGFAVNFADIKSIPATLPIADVSYAGENKKVSYKLNHAHKIMTGAPVPEGYDTVVKFEDCSYTDTEVTINIDFKKKQNVRMPSEDLQKGELVLKSGDLIKPIYIGILASMGLTEVAVFKKPRVLVFSSGDELVNPGEKLEYGQLYNSNSFTILNMIRPFCEIVDIIDTVKDKPEQIKSALSSDYDLIISSGGVSAGEKDLLPEISIQCGWEEVFHKVRIKPGKPVFYAVKNNQHFFGLPGNPLSTAVTCALFVIPALKKMIGSDKYFTEFINARLDTESSFKSGRTVFWPGTIQLENNQFVASFSQKRSSAALSALLGSDGLIMQTESKESPEIRVALWQKILSL